MSDDGWTWELSSTAEDDLDGLSPADQDRILDNLDKIVSSPWRDPPDCCGRSPWVAGDGAIPKCSRRVDGQPDVTPSNRRTAGDSHQSLLTPPGRGGTRRPVFQSDPATTEADARRRYGNPDTE